MKTRLRRWSPAFIGLIALIARLIPSPRTIDDAYITFRYARNLLAGNGFVFNPGEAVLGTTTPLYSILMAALGAMTGGTVAPFPEIAWILNAFLDGFGCLLLVLIGRKLGSELAGLGAGLVWAIAPMSVTFAIGGMETSLFITLLLAAFYLSLSRQHSWAALAASLALLTRPDGLLFIAPLFVERIRQLWPAISTRRFSRELALEGALYFGPLLIWLIVSLIIFGNPIPHSIAAKVSAYRLSPEAGLVRLLQHYGTPFLGHLTFGTYWIAVGLFLFPVLFFLGTLRTVRRHPEAWPLFLAPWLYFIAYSAANPLIFRWYLAPPLPFYFIGIFLGAARISEDIKSKIPLFAMSIAAVALTLVGWTLEPDHGSDQPAPEMAFIELELLYERIGKDLQDQIDPDERLAAADVGALGYYSQARILDTLGLISPESVGYYPANPQHYVINYAIPPELINELAPEYLVILEVYGREGLLVDENFVSNYRLIRTVGTDLYSSRGMLVFTRTR